MKRNLKYFEKLLHCVIDGLVCTVCYCVVLVGRVMARHKGRVARAGRFGAYGEAGWIWNAANGMREGCEMRTQGLEG